MNKKLIAVAVAASLAAPLAAQAKPEVKWFGFAQMTAESRADKKPNDGFVFGGDRIRIGFKLKDGPVFGKLQIDFNKTDSSANAGTLPQIIKDAVAGYKFHNAAKISLGQFKTPVGMDFNTSGKKLDITKRGMEKKLVLERAAGVMLSGRKIGGGFGYDIFYGNPSGRSSAVSAADYTVGKDTTTVVRVMYDMGKKFHIEASTGTSTHSATGTKNYTVNDVAFAFRGGKLTVKGEYISGNNVKGVDGDKETVWFAHGGFAFNKTVEAVLRYYNGSATVGGTKTSLTNTYIGVNLFLGSTKTDGRLQLNYVVAGGDKAGSSTTYGGVSKGYMDNAILAQYQVSF